MTQMAGSGGWLGWVTRMVDSDQACTMNRAHDAAYWITVVWKIKTIRCLTTIRVLDH